MVLRWAALAAFTTTAWVGCEAAPRPRGALVVAPRPAAAPTPFFPSEAPLASAAVASDTPPPSAPCPRPRADLEPLVAPREGLPIPPIERPIGLERFYDALARLDRGLAEDHVRIAVYGDSNLTMDYPTGRLRRLFSAAFGEGGHGFVAAGQPWSHYQHRDVQHGVVSGWKPYAITTAPTGDGLYGLGGIVVENEWQGATTFVATAREGAPVGTVASRFDVFYLQRGGGGRFDVIVDGRREARVETHRPRGEGDRSPRLGIARVEVEEGPHRVELVASSAAVTRLFGVALERREPGVVVDTFGIGALNTRAQAAANPALSTAMLRARGYELVVFLTGANDVFTMDAVPEAFRKLVALQRDALPGVPILVVSPADRGAKKSFPLTPQVVEQRQQLAEELDLPFWSLFEAMGGRDSMARFLRDGMANRDAIHWNQRGGDWAGDRWATALARGYAERLAAHPRAGCESPASLAKPAIGATDPVRSGTGGSHRP